MNKKVIKYVLVFLIIILTFFACDIAFFYFIRNENYSVARTQEKYLNCNIILPRYFIRLTKLKDVYNNEMADLRPVMNINGNERPVVIFGCSYAYGYVFENEETISYILSKYSKRPVFNRAISGWGLQHMLYQLENDVEMFEQIKNPKYVIYVLMNHTGHFESLYYTSFPTIIDKNYYYTYKLKNNKLVERKPLFNLYYGFAIPRHIYNKAVYNKVQHDFFEKPNKKLFDFFIRHILESKKLINEKWGNDVQFIILTFEHTQKEYWKPQLEEQGIKVVDIAETLGVQDLEQKELGFFEPEVCAHPNGKLWNELVPKLKDIFPDL